jgi:hypothetical protein
MLMFGAERIFRASGSGDSLAVNEEHIGDDFHYILLYFVMSKFMLA